MSDSENSAPNADSGQHQPSNMQQMMEHFFQQLVNMSQTTARASEGSGNGVEKIDFKLTRYDPDNSNYSMAEWLKDVNVIKIEQKISEQVMILKAGEALQGKARRFYDGWRPLVRNWSSFEEDLLTAFPDHETFHTKLLRAANMRSSEFNSISEYGLEKVRSLYRYYPDLPWDRVLSPVIGGITSNAVRDGIRLHQPKKPKGIDASLKTIRGGESWR